MFNRNSVRLLLSLCLLSGLLFPIQILAQIYEIDAISSPLSVCSGTFTDSNPNGDYSSDEDFTKTICSSTPGAEITFDFTMFDAESPTFDNLTIYDGTGTGGTLIGMWGYSDLVGETISSLGSGCLTFVWHSDGSVEYEGWTATISCALPCQAYTVNIDSTSAVSTYPDTLEICQNSPITFYASGTYPNSGTQYLQDDNNTTFNWNFGDGNTAVGATVTHSYTTGGGYFVKLTAVDINGCQTVSNDNIIAKVSTTPLFSSTTIDVDTICLGEGVNLVGTVQSVPWSVSFPPPFSQTSFLPDNQTDIFTNTILFETFSPGATMTGTTNILDICLNMEHSYMGDLGIFITCPNGQTTDILDNFANFGGGTIIGEPVASDLTVDDLSSGDPNYLTPGIGYDYCFSPTSANGYIYDAANWTYLPTYTDPVGNFSDNFGSGINQATPGTYQIDGNWNDLIGCPLNGEWVISVQDNLGSDNGYIFEWMINFDPTLVSTEMEFTTIFDSTSFINSWSGEGMVSQINGIGSAVPFSSGNVSYTFTATDNYGCSYDTSVFVYVKPAGSVGCCVPPVTNAGNDNAVCALSDTLKASLTPGNTGFWINGAGPGNVIFNDSLNDTTEVQVDAYGSYVFIWADVNSSACQGTDTVLISFFETPTSDFQLDSIDCFGDSTIVTYLGSGSPTANYSWGFGSGAATGSGQGPYTVDFLPGVHSVTLSVDENGCFSDLTSKSIYAPEDFIYKPTKLDNFCNGQCAGAAAVGPEGGSPPFTYSWASGSDTLDNLCAGSYDVTVVDNNGCSIDHTFIINQPTQIGATLSSTTTYCNQNIGSLTATPFGGVAASGSYSYQWDDPNTQATQTASNLFAGIFNLTITDDYGCSFVTLGNVSNLDGVANDTIAITHVNCYGIPDGSATVTISGGTANYIYAWSNGIISAPTNNTSHTVTGLAAGTYSVIITDATNCQASEIFIITQPTKLTDSVVGTPVSCYGGSDGTIDLTVISGSGTAPYSYIWSPDGQTVQDLSGLNEGTYSVVIKDANNCSISDQFTITQPANALTASIVGTNISCYGGINGMISLSVSFGTSPYSYIWSNAANSQNLIYLNTDNYTVIVTDANFCTTTASVFISEPLPLVSSISSTNITCYGYRDGIITLTQPTGGTSPFSYLWSNSMVSRDIGGLDEGIYRVTITDDNGCSMVLKDTIFEPQEVIISSLHDTTLCLGQSLTLTAASTTDSLSYYWSTGEIGDEILISPQTTTILSVYGLTTAGCKSFQNLIKISVLPPIDLSIVLVDNNDTSICQGDKIEITYDSLSGGLPPYYTFALLIEDTVVPILLPYIDYPSQTTSYTIIATDQCGSPEGSDELQVVVHNAPPNNISVDDYDGCIPFTVAFQDNSSSNSDIVDYTWDFGDGSTGSSLKNTYHTYENTGSYSVSLLTKSSYGCLTYVMHIKEINVYSLPDAKFSFDPPTVNVLDGWIHFQNFSFDADTSYWNFGDGSEITIEENPSHEYSKAGVYNPTLVVATENGCRDTVSLEDLIVNEEFTFYCPTAIIVESNITQNRKFLPVINGINEQDDYELYIYDRWGLLVFHTNDYKTGWDGKIYNKGYGITGVYTWFLAYSTGTSIQKKETHEETGSVTLIR